MINTNALVPLTQDELTQVLTTTTTEYRMTVPLRQDVDGRLCIDADDVSAQPALAKLANLRRPMVRVGGPIQHIGPRELGASNPEDRLAGYVKCEDCGGAEFSCSDAISHEDGGENGHGYTFPDYGARLDRYKIQKLIAASGLVTEYGAAQLAVWLDMQAYVLREPDEEI
jgi:hypothetical protein